MGCTTYAQQCGVYSNGDNIFMEINGDLNAQFDIKVYWNWVRQDDGSSANSEALVKSIIARVKAEFSTMGIHFVSGCNSTEDNFRIVDDSDIASGDSGNSNCFLDDYCFEDGLNVFFLDGNPNGRSSGLASQPGNRLFVKLDEIDEYITVMHEIGHCFGLFHTWADRPWVVNTPIGQWECDNQGGVTGTIATLSDCNNQTVFTQFVPFSLVDNSNASTTGDFVTDTPADINYDLRCETDQLDCTDGEPCELDDVSNRYKDPNCQAYQPDYNNYMGARGYCQDHFTDGQIARMKGVIANNLSYMLMPGVVSISEDQTIEIDGSFGDIRVNPNVHLTIKNSNLYFAENGEIYLDAGAKITIDNSTLTSCDDIWSGIVCSPEATNVEVRNNSIIENAEIGIALKPLPFGPAQPIDPGIHHPTLIMNDHATIRHCDIGIQFGLGQSGSTMDFGCRIANNRIGLMYQNHSGLVINNGIFQGNEEAINSIDGYMHIRHLTQISGNTVGIRVEGTLPLASGIRIGDNEDYPNWVSTADQAGIISNGSEHPASVVITNCIFNNNGEGAFVALGANEFQFQNNNISNVDHGTFVFGSGTNFNTVNCNVFKDIDQVSAILMFLNDRSNILENQFIGDQNINIGHVVSSVPTQGTADNPAANCFSDPNQSAHIVNSGFLTVPPTPFIYHYYDEGDDPDACQEPIDPDNFDAIDSDIQGFGNCEGNIGIFNLISPGGPGSVVGINPQVDDPNVVCLDCIRDEIDDWIDIVVGTGGDDPTTLPNEENLPGDPALPMNEAILDQWISYALYIALETNNTAYGVQVLAPMVTWRWKVRLYGLYALNGDYANAEAVLASLTADNANQIQFKQVQQVNIKRIKREAISASEIDLVHSIALGNEPASGYARSLHGILAGTKLPIEYPNISKNSTPRSANYTIGQSTIYPNPASGMVYIKNGVKIKEITMIDISGREVSKMSSNKRNVEVDISTFEDGVYIFQIVDEGGKVETRKLIKL